MLELFLDNKYTKTYYAIIESAKSSEPHGYYEKHHIIPKSLGGSNKKDNIVKLTARQHFICHWLLTKMVDSHNQYKMNNAFSCMLYRENDSQQRYKITSRLFEILKSKQTDLKRERMSGENNPMFGKTHSTEAKEKIREVHTGRVKSEQERKNISKSLTGLKKSDSHKESLKSSWKKTKSNRSGKNHPMYGKNHSDSTIKKIKDAGSKKCVSPTGVVFDSISDAAIYEGITQAAMSYRIKHGKSNWRLLEGGY